MCPNFHLGTLLSIQMYEKLYLFGIIYLKEVWAMKKRRIGLVLITICIIIFVFYNKRVLFFNEVAELDVAAIERVQITYPEGLDWYELNSKELEQLNAILSNLEVSKKLIPNIQAFNADSYIAIKGNEIETDYTIKFDYDRNIIGIIRNCARMEQYIVKNDSDLFFFVQNLIKNNVKNIKELAK